MSNTNVKMAEHEIVVAARAWAKQGSRSMWTSKESLALYDAVQGLEGLHDEDAEQIGKLVAYLVSRVAGVRGERGRDFIRSLPFGKLLDDLDAGAAALAAEAAAEEAFHDTLAAAADAAAEEYRDGA